MELVIADNYKELSRWAADDLVRFATETANPLICTASGDTPAGLYKEIVERVNKRTVDISKWTYLGLDEWVGMDGNDEGSCRFHLNNQFFHPLRIPENKIIFFDGHAADLDRECERIENSIGQHHGIDVSILGLGMNGHIGMNEPGTPVSSRSHISALDPVTKQVGQKYFKEKTQLTDGITLGLATLLESKYIILLASGGHKAGIVRQVVEGEISEKVPGSLLRNHPGLHIYLDSAAAELLQRK
jgi:galactosamine-6-phosphate isomerase